MLINEFINRFKEEISLPEFFTEDEGYYIRENIEECFGDDTFEDIAWGVTKFVIILKDSDYVIKIPFKGRLEDRYCYDCSRTDCNGECNYCSYNEYSTNGEFYAQAAIGNRAKLKNSWDYCEVESIRYRLAEMEGLQKFFAKTTLIDEIDGYPIYIQEKIRLFSDDDWDDDMDKRIEESQKTLTTKYPNLHSEANPLWIMNVVNMFGEEEADRLCKFIEHYHIRDLHTENIGYRNGVPIMSDYSSYEG